MAKKKQFLEMTHDERMDDISNRQINYEAGIRKIWENYAKEVDKIQKNHQLEMERHHKLVNEIKEVIAEINAIHKQIDQNKEEI